MLSILLHGYNLWYYLSAHINNSFFKSYLLKILLHSFYSFQISYIPLTWFGLCHIKAAFLRWNSRLCSQYVWRGVQRDWEQWICR